LAPPPAHLGPLHLAAGVAVGAAIAAGRRAALLCLGAAFAAQLGARLLLGQSAAAAAALCAVSLVAPLLAMALCAAFARAEFDRPGVFARFFALGAALPAAVAGAAVAALGQSAWVTVPLWGDSAVLWWFADAAGITLGAPLALALARRPAVAWAQRSRTVVVPLAALAALLALGPSFLARAEVERRAYLFRRDALAIADRVEQRFAQHLSALHALSGAFAASSEVTRAEFRRVSAHWLAAQPTLAALGWSQRVDAAQLAEFERRVREQRPSFYVFDRGNGERRTPAPADEYVVLTYIEPEAENATALGVNALSIPAPRDAILRALQTGLPSATQPFRLTQGPDDAYGMVVYLPADANGRADDPWRQRGVAFVTLRLDGALAGLQDSALVVCLREGARDAPLLAGDARCRSPWRAARRLEHSFDFGGRTLTVELIETAEYRALHGVGLLRALPPLAVALTALLAGFVLYVAGSAERVRRVVARRTDWLRREMAQRRKQQEALRESEERVRRILELAPIGLTYADPQGRLLYANPYACSMFGRSLAELQQMTVFELWDPQTHAENSEIRRRLLSGEAPLLRRTLRFVRPDGGTVTADVTAAVERDAHGRPLRVLSVLEELSTRMRLQEAERARVLAEEANRAKTEFLSRMSHELRTPLNAILGFAQLLEMDPAQPLAPAQRERVQRIQTAGWHLLAMINDVLDLSRIEAGQMALSIETLDLAALADEVVAMHRTAIAAAGLQVRDQVAAAARYARGDATRVKQVLSNLLSNAIKYNRRGGTIEISATREDAHVRLEVADTGLGMSDEQMRRLFQPFDRLGREASGIEGTGIGLVIAQRLVALMGGELRVASRPGEGSRFGFTLPAAAAPQPGAPSADAQPNGAALAARLLYIEDNAANADVMRGLLATQPGLVLTVSDSGLEGLAQARRDRPDAILLDLNLPDMDGLQVLTQLKRDPVLATVPVIVVSADATEQRIDAARAAGAAEYLAKPLRAAQLLAAIERALRR
jgi:PAS domain S-box-containing protein